MIGQLNIRRKLDKSVLSLLFITIVSAMLASCDDECDPPISTPSQVSVQDNGDGTCVTLEELKCTCQGSKDTGRCLATLGAKRVDSIPVNTTFSTTSACPSQINCVDLGIVCQ